MARDSWTDARLDDLNTKVDRGFESVDKRFDKVDKRFDNVDEKFNRVDEKFERVEDDIKEFRTEMNGRLDSQYQLLLSQNRLLIMSMIGLFGCMFTGFAGLIAAQIWA